MKKTLLSLLLIFCMLASCACAGKSNNELEEEDTSVAYVWDDSDLVRPVGATYGYGCSLTGDAAKDKEIWDWAEQCYQEWYVRYQEIRNTPDPDINEINSDGSDQFDQTITAYNTQIGTKAGGYKGTVKTRTLSSLKDFTPIETEFDQYGGWVNESLRQKSTGYFYTAKLGDRWYLIDPLGYPTIIRGVSGLTYMYGGAKEQEDSMIARYQTGEKWGIAVTRILADDLYINSCSILSPGSKYLNVEQRLCYQDKLAFVSQYERSLGAKDLVTESGSTLLLDGMHVFDPGFEAFCDEYAKNYITVERASYLDDPYFIGFATDNEIPVDESKMGITKCLGLDYTKTDYDNRYSYATAWTFLAHLSGKSNPTESDVTTEIRELFKGFVYDRYFSIVVPIVKKYDPNHMVLGNRALNSFRKSEWIVRFTAYWNDVITINWYLDWTPQQEQLNNVSKWANKPFLVTEYFVTSEECKVDPYEYPIKNIVYKVNTQEDRAKGYENYFLRLLECQNCVGFNWFDSIDQANGKKGSNKGIFAGDQTLYEELAASMGNIGKNIYGLATYFDSKY